jgi:hypothetical protein
MLIIDCFKYKFHVPKDEKELEGMVKEHFADIFGENSARSVLHILLLSVKAKPVSKIVKANLFFSLCELSIV